MDRCYNVLRTRSASTRVSPHRPFSITRGVIQIGELQSAETVFWRIFQQWSPTSHDSEAADNYSTILITLCSVTDRPHPCTNVGLTQRVS